MQIMKLARTGYWFCEDCSLIVGVEHDEKADATGQPAIRCAKCFGVRVKWNPPCIDSEAPEELRLLAKLDRLVGRVSCEK